MTQPLLLAALLLAALPVAQAADEVTTPAAPTVAERLANARAAIAAKEWSRAMRELNVAVREQPRNADVHNLLGYAYRKRASPDLGKALEHYQTALQLDPRHKGAHEYIGEAYLMKGEPAQAQRHLAELEKICGGQACEEYQDLAKAIAAHR